MRPISPSLDLLRRCAHHSVSGWVGGAAIFGACIDIAQRQAQVAKVRAAASASGTAPVAVPPVRPGA